MTTLYLIRHAEAEGNVSRHFHGQTDGGVTGNGLKQLERLARCMDQKNLDIIYTSDLRRAYMTAQACSRDGAVPFITEKRLREIDGGDWEGMSFADIGIKYAEQFDNFNKNPHACALPGGESVPKLRERAVQAVLEIIEKNPGRRIGVVSHGTVIRVLTGYFRGLPLLELHRVGWADNTSITKVICNEDGGYEVRYEGNNGHVTGISTFETQKWWENIGSLDKKQ